MPSLLEKIEAARAKIAGISHVSPEIGIILGTGLGSIADCLQIETQISFSEIPNMPQPTVDGHEGKFLFGKLNGKSVALMQGRLHFYEGFSMEEISFPVRLMKALGIQSLLITNIAGGVNPAFFLGDIMMLTDHINLLGSNPLIGKNHDALGPRFPDMSEPYNREYILKISALGKSLGLNLQRGVYASMSGPCLETAAEYRMLRIIGADAVGMSTIPEVIAAVHGGLKVAALSLITDVCDPDNLKPINIPEIMRVVKETEPQLAQLIRGIVEQM
jgi:purine-nucleoside phosphorylase